MTDQRDDDLRLKISTGGRIYDIDIKRDFTALDARAFREQLGFGFSEGINNMMDPDVLATLVWLYRRKSNRRLSWNEVAEHFTFGDVEATGEELAKDARAASNGQVDEGEEDDGDPS